MSSRSREVGEDECELVKHGEASLAATPSAPGYLFKHLCWREAKLSAMRTPRGTALLPVGLHLQTLARGTYKLHPRWDGGTAACGFGEKRRSYSALQPQLDAFAELGKSAVGLGMSCSFNIYMVERMNMLELKVARSTEYIPC